MGSQQFDVFALNNCFVLDLWIPFTSSMHSREVGDLPGSENDSHRANPGLFISKLELIPCKGGAHVVTFILSHELRLR